MNMKEKQYEGAELFLEAIKTAIEVGESRGLTPEQRIVLVLEIMDTFKNEVPGMSIELK